MRYSLRLLLLITLSITCLSSADNSTTPVASTTPETSTTPYVSTASESLETSTIDVYIENSEETTSQTPEPCNLPIERRLILEWSFFYIILAFILFLSFLVFSFLILWIRDTEKLKKEVRELKKQAQDMEQYGIIKPVAFTPRKEEEVKKEIDEKEKSKVKVVDEVAPGKKDGSKTPIAKESKKKAKTKKSAKKSTKKKVSEKAGIPANKSEKTKTTSTIDSFKSGKTSSTTAETNTTEDSKATENSVTSNTEGVTDESPETIESVATAEVDILSQRKW